MYSQIDKNKRLTTLILMFFVFVVSFAIWIFSFSFFQDIYASVFFGFIAFFFSIISSLFSYYGGAGIVLRMSRAQEITNDPTYSNLLERFRILLTKAGLPSDIKLYIIPDSALNAFATGRGPKDGHVALTAGLLQRLNDSEVDAVIAHELSHIRNYDIRLMMIVSVLAGVLTTVADFFLRSLFWSSGNRDSKSSGNPIVLLIAVIFAILSPIIALLIQTAISRRREFLADMSAVEITRNPQGMIDALKKLQLDTKPVDSASTGTAHMYIDFPVKDAGSFFSNMFSTHPPIEERIKAIQEI